MSDDAPTPDRASEPQPDPSSPGWAAPTTPTPTTPTPTSPPPATAAAASASWGPAPVATTTSESWATPAPPPKRKLTWLWILIGTLTVIAALVVTGVVLFVRNIAGPIDATNTVLRRVRQGDYAAAQRASCKYDRALDPAEYARAFKDTIGERGKITGYDVNYSSVHGDRATVRYDIEWARNRSLRFEAVALKENGTWRTCLLKGG